MGVGPGVARASRLRCLLVDYQPADSLQQVMADGAGMQQLAVSETVACCLEQHSVQREIARGSQADLLG